MFHQTFCFFYNHFSNLNVARRRFIKGRGHNLPLHRTLHVGHFFWPFIDQKNDQKYLWMVFRNGARDILKQHGFTRAWRRNDQGTLALALRADNIDDARGLVLDGRVQRIQREL